MWPVWLEVRMRRRWILAVYASRSGAAVLVDAAAHSVDGAALDFTMCCHDGARIGAS
jgi:hypothetical protein